MQSRSVRISLLSALLGIHVNEGNIDLNSTLKELWINDFPFLWRSELNAKVIHLLKSRSGVYHKAAGESQILRDLKPKRGSHDPDTFWYYNNWGFNALGTIFRKRTGTDIFEEFKKRIADPIGMQDFRINNCMSDSGSAYAFSHDYCK